MNLRETLTVRGTLDELGLVHDWTRDLLARHGIPGGEQHNVLLAVSEAVTNAIRHGCGENCEKSVTIEASIDRESLQFEVHDSGPGFSLETLPDPTVGSHLLRAGGRGVFLMRQLSKEIKFTTSEKGTTVSFSFRRTN